MSGGGQNTSFGKKQLVIYHRKRGKNCREIARLLMTRKSTVVILLKDIEKKIVLNLRNKKGSEKEKRRIIRRVKENPHYSNWPQIFVMKKVSAETVRRIMRCNAFNGRLTRRKLHINEINGKNRLAFVKEFFKKPENWRNDVTFAESKYCIFGSDRKSIAWRRVNKALKSKNLESTLKYRGDSVILWGCISSVSVDELVFIEDILHKNRYLHFLKNNLLKSANNIGIQSTSKFY